MDNNLKENIKQILWFYTIWKSKIVISIVNFNYLVDNIIIMSQKVYNLDPNGMEQDLDVTISNLNLPNFLLSNNANNYLSFHDPENEYRIIYYFIQVFYFTILNFAKFRAGLRNTSVPVVTATDIAMGFVLLLNDTISLFSCQDLLDESKFISNENYINIIKEGYYDFIKNTHEFVQRQRPNPFIGGEEEEETELIFE